MGAMFYDLFCNLLIQDQNILTFKLVFGNSHYHPNYLIYLYIYILYYIYYIYYTSSWARLRPGLNLKCCEMLCCLLVRNLWKNH